jgi:RNA polymerase sigma factor (sigma-70 family)
MDPATSAPPERRPLAALDCHTAMLRRYLLTLGARPDRIGDLIQEAFVVSLQKGVEDQGRAAIASWLRGVVRNLLLRERRSAGARREVELAGEVWRERCADGDGDELVDAMRECIRQLPARGQAIVQRVYGDGDGRAAIGAEFGLVADGVKTALRRLRTALKECLERRLRGGA